MLDYTSSSISFGAVFLFFLLARARETGRKMEERKQETEPGTHNLSPELFLVSSPSFSFLRLPLRSPRARKDDRREKEEVQGGEKWNEVQRSVGHGPQLQFPSSTFHRSCLFFLSVVTSLLLPVARGEGDRRENGRKRQRVVRSTLMVLAGGS